MNGAPAAAAPPRSTRARRGFVLAAVLAVIAALVVEMHRPLARAATEVRRGFSESSGVVRVEGHAALLRLAGEEVGIDPNLLAGLVFVESRGKVGALSGAEALGLFQLKLATAVERAVLIGLDPPTREQLLEDAELNALIGAHHLQWLLARYDGDIVRALIAYNAGSGRLERWIKEYGGFERWRDQAESSGKSDVLAYVAEVLHRRDFFAERATICAPIGPPAPNQHQSSSSANAAAVESLIGPLGPQASHGDL
ncbi:MAG: transglycosylase SLT domain-containing protein [Planctomycetes bacterium]|nr:transglycosylase SLT domain-containing protein [Planctomycetota bacterium]